MAKTYIPDSKYCHQQKPNFWYFFFGCGYFLFFKYQCRYRFLNIAILVSVCGYRLSLTSGWMAIERHRQHSAQRQLENIGSHINMQTHARSSNTRL